MKIKSMYRIEEAAAEKKSNRYVIKAVHVAKVDGSAKAIATNGRILAMVPVELEDGDKEQVNVSQEAFKLAREASKKFKNSLANIQLNGSATVHLEHGERSFSYEDFGQYPNFAQVLPKPAERSVTVTLDVKLLERLWKALGGNDKTASGVVMKIGLDCRGQAELTRPVEISVPHGEGYGIIMPMRTA